MADPGREPLPTSPKQFDREIDYRWIRGFAITIILVMVFAFLAVRPLSRFFQDHLAASDDPGSPLLEAGQTTTPPEPHLQVESYADWTEMKAAHDHSLSTFGWVDREAGRVRIPVEEAMAEIAAHGLPDFEPVGDGTLSTDADEVR